MVTAWEGLTHALLACCRGALRYWVARGTSDVTPRLGVPTTSYLHVFRAHRRARGGQLVESFLVAARRALRL